MKRRFSAIFFVGLLAEIIIRVPYDRERRRIQKVDQRVTTTEQLLLGGVSAGMFGLPLLYSLSDRLDFADYRISPELKQRLGWFGALILAAALWLFWRSHHDLGKNWSPSLEIGEAQNLITEGVYAKVRHPMYASQLLWGIAQALLLQNWVAGLAGLGTFVLLYLLRLPNEEQMMLDHFGDQYRAYSEKTGRVLPRIG